MSNPKQIKSERKVYYGDYKPINGRRNPYPVIRLGGKYLKRSGFDIGDSIDVSVENEQITIRKIHKEAEGSRNEGLKNIRSSKERANDMSQTR